MKAKVHPEEEPRGVRDPRTCRAQAGGKLVWIEDGQPMFWTDRPFKFAGHIALRMTKRGGVDIRDVKWMQLGGSCWWRIPEFPTGILRILPDRSEQYRREFMERRRDVEAWREWLRRWTGRPPVHYSYEDVLRALEDVGPASTMVVFSRLVRNVEGRRVNKARSVKQRRDWMFRALMNMARSGRVEYVIEPRGEDGRAYIWNVCRGRGSDRADGDGPRAGRMMAR